MLTGVQVVVFGLLKRIVIKAILLGVWLDLAFNSSEVLIVEIVFLLIETLRLFFLLLKFGAFGKVLVDAVVIAEVGLERARLLRWELVVGGQLEVLFVFGLG